MQPNEPSSPVPKQPPTVLTVPPTSLPSALAIPMLSSAGIPAVAGSHADASLPLPVVPGYDVLGMLGRGGMGVVYLARQVGLDRLVALKMVLAGPYAREEDRRRFIVEAQAVARLHHPSIVQIYQVGEHDGFPYFSLEYCDCGSLAARLNGTPLPPADGAQIVRTLASAMQAAHDAGIIHRDLKPANALLRRKAKGQKPNANEVASCSGSGTGVALSDLDAKVSDFGLAKRLNAEPAVAADVARTQATLSGAIVGTPNYMAPEQALGSNRTVGPPADIYALGAILYECLTGRPPFVGAEPLETLYAVVSTEPVAPMQLNPRVPRDLDTICLKCLQKAEARRYASAADLAEDLRRFEAGEPIRARPVSRLERAVKWARKRPTTAALVAVLLLLIGGAIAAGFWYQKVRFDQLQEQARLQVRKEGVEEDIHAALQEIDSRRKALLERLGNPLGTAELSSDLDGWKVALLQMQAVWSRAERLATRNADVVAAEFMDAVQHLRRQLDADQENWKVARELDEIRVSAFRMVQNHVDRSLAGPRYAEVFSRLGLDVANSEPDQLAASIRQQPLRFVLVAALDSWASLTTDTKGLLPRLLQISREADPHPARNQVRDLRTWANKDLMEKWLREAVIAEHPPQFLYAVALLLHDTGSDENGFLRTAVRHYPRDFWLNFLVATHSKERTAQIACLRGCLIIRPHNPLAHNNLGLVLMESGDIEGGVFHFLKAIEYDPEFAGAYLNLGNALQRKKDLKAAILQLQKTLEVDPNYVFAHLSLGVVLREDRNLQGAIDQGEIAVRLAPNNPVAHTQLALWLHEARQVPAALAHYRRALQLNPRDAATHHNYANALRAVNDLEGAITHFRQAIKLDPKLAEAYSSLGSALRSKHDVTGALFCTEEAVKLNPRSAGMQVNLGNALNDSKEWQRAIVAFTTALEIDPTLRGASRGLVTAHANQGLILAAKNDLAGAAIQFDKALGLDPGNALIHFHYANVLADGKRFPDAILHYEQAIRIDPTLAGTYRGLGNVFRARNELDRAIKQYQKAVELDDRDASTHSLLGRTFHEKHDLDAATMHFKKAIGIDSKQPTLYYQLGNVLREQGKVDDAIAAFRQAIQVQPDYAEAHCHLGGELLKTGAFTDGLEALRRGHDLGSKRPDWKNPSAEWVQRAERLVALDAKLTAYLKGKSQPKDNQERLDLIGVCTLKKQHVGAARLYADAFAADAKLADDLQGMHRYIAASHAAMAGNGQDTAARLPGEERAHWRQQALAWLRADLALCTRKAEAGKAAEREQARKLLGQWREDADLAGIRDPETLARLPEGERRESQRFWADVEALFKRTRP
jgi:serine/threonine-protein kinase